MMHGVDIYAVWYTVLKICFLLHAHKFRMEEYELKGNRLTFMEIKNLI
jgi:hypothetical protein